MSGSYSIKLRGQAPVAIDKPYFTVGIGGGYDIALPGSDEKILFSIHCESGSCTLIPGEEKVRVNGKAINKPTTLEVCDRIEWRESIAIFVDDVAGGSAKADSGPADSKKAFEILQKLAQNWDKDISLSAALTEALGDITELAGGELGYLVSEIGAEGEWSLIASVGDPEAERRSSSKRRELVSSTILHDAIEKRRPVYIESMIGHQWQSQESIILSKIFSLACLPLIVGDRIFGAVYLYTRTPGRSIKKNSLEDLGIISGQIGLLLASRAELRRTQRENQRLKSNCASEKPLIYDRENSKGPMYGLDQRLSKLAQSDLSILIRGETGTGKELIAREIHQMSSRNKGPFVAINCAAIPPSLMESTLFGSTKGSFTGALKDRPGKFVQANGGTIFLDEIGDLPLELQVKLLRVLQEKEVEAVGADKPVSVDFRVVAATHQNLEQAVADGKFRQDLYYRLNGASLMVPALRERGNDILLLAKHFLGLHSPELSFSDDAMDLLRSHQWPGNVRELEQVVGRAAALSSNKEIQPEDLELSVNLPVSTSISQEFYQYDDLQGLKEVQMAFTQDYVKRTLTRFGGNRAKVASHLGISERTLYRLLAGESDKLV